MLRILAPAFSAEAVIAAVQSGADEIYIGFGGGGARGFTEAELRKAVRYCRVRGCRVWAALDMLVADTEMSAAIQLAQKAMQMGAYGLICQDWGLLRCISSAAPGLKLAAGERMGLHSLAGVEAAAQLGASRVFLPKELSRVEMARLAARTRVELAVTVWDEMCASRAGLCYLSALTEKKSANRGQCTGLCRNEYSLGGRLDDKPMSLCDVDLISHLAELNEMGVACAAIGAGLTRPEQVSIITRVCTDCLAAGRQPSPGERTELSHALSGRARTDAWFMERPEQSPGQHGQPERESDKALNIARRAYVDSERRRVALHFYAVVQRGKAIRFAAEDEDGNRAVWTGPAANAAKGTAVTAQKIETELRKTAGTPYSCERVDCAVDEGLEMSEELITEGRRRLLHMITQKRGAAPKCSLGLTLPPPTAKPASSRPAYIFQVCHAEQLTTELAELRPDYVYLPLAMAAEEEGGRLRPFIERGCTPVAVLPAIVPDAEVGALAGALMKARAAGINQALAGSFGHVAIARAAGMDLRGDYGLNLYNSFALEAADKAGFLSATVSFELPLPLITRLSKPLDTEIIVYGRLPVMLTEICLIKNSAGRCVCTARQAISDNRGGVMPVLREPPCRNAVYSSRKVFLGDKTAELDKAGLWGRRLLFTTEGPRECVEVAKIFTAGSSYRPNGLTRGLY